MTTRRAGAALVMALLLLVVLDCIVLGTLHLSLQEHRIGANRAEALRLRLEANDGARRALAHWSAAFDTMGRGSSHRVPVAAAASTRTAVSIERLADDHYLIEAIASERPPRAGRAVARLLVTPPVLPHGADPAPATISSAGPVRIGATAVIRATPPPGCSAAAAPTTLTHQFTDVATDPAASLDAPAAVFSGPDLIGAFDRIAALARARDPASAAVADTTIGSTAAGVLIVDGDLVLAAGVSFDGLLIVGGRATIEQGARMRGALHARAGALVDGHAERDPCIVADAIAAARLDRPYPAGPRPWLPAF